jgi:hypothetical protein
MRRRGEDIMRLKKKERSKENNINKQDLTLIKYKISKEKDSLYCYSLVAVTFVCVSWRVER